MMVVDALELSFVEPVRTVKLILHCQISGRKGDLARFSPKLRWCVLFPITDSNGKRTSRVKLEPGKPASILRPESDVLLGKFPAT